MKKQIAIYSALHFLVDFLCAVAMFGIFIPGKSGYLWILIYNFCAFALQMPFGVILDRFDDGRGNRSAAEYVMISGVLLTVAGMFLHPVILGIGNAMFHIGGGVGTIREDNAGHYQGAGLGVFVAPGALGLYAGTFFSKSGWYIQCQTTGVILSVILLWILIRYGQESKWQRERDKENVIVLPSGQGILWMICLLVVVLRSYVGMAVSFPWKTTAIAAMVCVLAVVLGKVAGGFFAAKAGITKAAVYSLAAAAVFYLFSDMEAAGILALFFFNMSMPMTLYLLVSQYKGAEGFAFGLLTFGLFLGYLPMYFMNGDLLNGRIVGCAGSLISLVLLYKGAGRNYVNVLN